MLLAASNSLLRSTCFYFAQMGNVTKANEIHAEVEKLLSNAKGDNLSACCNAMNK